MLSSPFPFLCVRCVGFAFQDPTSGGRDDERWESRQTAGLAPTLGR